MGINSSINNQVMQTSDIYNSTYLTTMDIKKEPSLRVTTKTTVHNNLILIQTIPFSLTAYLPISYFPPWNTAL